jgi:hypothetical protein
VVDHFAVRCLHAQLVADADVLERAELLVAMRRDRAVAFLPRTRRIRQVAGGAVERLASVALDDSGRELEPRNLEQPDQIGAKRRIFDRRFRGREHRLDRRARFLLGVGSVGNGEPVVPDRREPNHEERSFKQLQHHRRSLST